MKTKLDRSIGRREFLAGSVGSLVAAGAGACAPRSARTGASRWSPDRKVLFVCVDGFGPERHVVFGSLERTREDVAIRSHGSRHEATVPIICYGRDVDASRYRRNIDLTRNFEWEA